MNNKLISMTSFVLEELKYKESEYYEYNSNDNDRSLGRIENYAKFLKQPLTLGMFVPCDEKGNVLSEPFYDPANAQYWAAAHFEFESAKERVLFKGWKVVIDCKGFYRIDNGEESRIFMKDSIFYTDIEHLLNESFEYELTESALKQITV